MGSLLSLIHIYNAGIRGRNTDRHILQVQRRTCALQLEGTNLRCTDFCCLFSRADNGDFFAVIHHKGLRQGVLTRFKRNGCRSVFGYRLQSGRQALIWAAIHLNLSLIHIFYSLDFVMSSHFTYEILTSVQYLLHFAYRAVSMLSTYANPVDFISKQSLDSICTPVSYTHLDVYKRQVAHNVHELIH